MKEPAFRKLTAVKIKEEGLIEQLGNKLGAAKENEQPDQAFNKEE